MRAAIIALETSLPPAGKSDSNSRINQTAMHEANAVAQREQALALCSRLLESNLLDPVLVCAVDSPLANLAQKADLPTLQLLTGANPLDLLRLWSWQRSEAKLTVLALGAASLKCAAHLGRMRKKGSLQINAALFTSHANRALGKYLAKAAHCVYGSNYIREEIEQALKREKKRVPPAIVQAPGINLGAFATSVNPWTEARHFVFGMAGSLLPQSGALMATRAMAGLWQKENLPAWELRMFGQGSRFKEILAEAKNLGVNSRLSILWQQPLPEVISGCDVWLAPGSAPEEAPQTLWAGTAAGLPVICSQSPLHLERLPDAALAIDCGNPQELAKAMSKVMQEPLLRQSLAKASRKHRPQIGLETMASHVCSLLEQWSVEEF